MFVRRRPLLRAAVVGGGAYVAGRSMGRRAEQGQQAEYEQNERISNLEQQQPAQAAAPQLFYSDLIEGPATGGPMVPSLTPVAGGAVARGLDSCANRVYYECSHMYYA